MRRNVHVIVYEYGVDGGVAKKELTILKDAEATVSHNLGPLGELAETSVAVRRNIEGDFWWRATKALEVDRHEQPDPEREEEHSDDYLFILNRESRMGVSIHMEYEE